MDDSIKLLLMQLITLLKNPAIKSKQAAFNACYDQLTEAKNLASWETIVAIIADETGYTLDARTASNMYGRSRRKTEGKKTEPNGKKSLAFSSDTKNTQTSEVENHQEIKAKVTNPGDLKKLRNRRIDLDDLKNGD
ncbi:hypothetical protein SAMN04487787_12829 [Kosakonia sacchari]|nr:hypothetical protein SAMN04487787_12829 [Kosakonia sacchari]